MKRSSQEELRRRLTLQLSWEVSCSICLFDSRCKELQQPAPSVRRIDGRSHPRRATTVPLEMTMFEIHASAALGSRCESNLYFARLRQIRLVSPFRRNLPREDDTARWVPHQDASPVGLRAVFLFGVTAA